DRLSQRDVVRDLMLEPDSIDGERHLRGQLLIAFEMARFDRFANGLFDCALRGDADAFQESAQAFVEDVFIHDCLLLRQGLTGLFSIYSPRSRWLRSARAWARCRCTSRSLRQATYSGEPGATVLLARQ